MKINMKHFSLLAVAMLCLMPLAGACIPEEDNSTYVPDDVIDESNNDTSENDTDVSEGTGSPFTTLDKLKTFTSWDKTDLAENGTLSSELSSVYAENAYDNGIPMGIVKFYNPEEQIGYYFAYTMTPGKDIVYIDAENDMLYSSLNTAKDRLAYRGVHFTNVVYSLPYPELDVIDEKMNNTIAEHIIIN